MMVGCSSSNKKLKELNQSRSLKLSETVIIKDDMFFSDVQSSIRGGINSLLGDAIANGMDNKKEKFIKTMETNDIDIKNIVFESASEELKKAGINNSNDSEFELQFVVRLYGFGQRQGFSKELRPIMVIEAKIINSNNEVVFKDVENITTMNSNTEHHKTDEYIGDYNKIENALKGVSSIAISNIIKNLK
ncbi:hypothetical protein NRK67_14240 [Fusobacteria bacterium ZRK30]|nr:hypothetical protein NRK67_14240 [Fusobacteria bacterium ZRK30]